MQQDDKPNRAYDQALLRRHGADTDSATSPLGVLVVDDDHTLARLLGDGLKATGHDVHVVNSAAAARQVLLTRADIGVVVSDIRMPGGDGLDLALEIAATVEDVRAVSVVLITGHATIEDVARAVRTGAADFLRKPCRLSELVCAVGRGMAKARQRRCDAQRQVVLDRHLADLEAERSTLLMQVREASQRLTALRGSHHHPQIERDIMAVSHALRTPLNAIAGGAALLESRQASGAAASTALGLLRDGMRQAVVAVELVEELQRLKTEPPDDVPADTFQLAEATGRAIDRMREEALAAGFRLTPPAPIGPSVRVPRQRFDRAAELCIAAALESALPDDAIEVSCDSATADGTAWAWMTLVVSRSGHADRPSLPLAPELPASGTPHSSTQETLRFFVARRIAEQIGGRLTSCTGPERSFAIRFALPCER